MGFDPRWASASIPWWADGRPDNRLPPGGPVTDPRFAASTAVLPPGGPVATPAQAVAPPAPADHSQAWLDIVGPISNYLNKQPTPQQQAAYALTEASRRPFSPIESVGNYFTAGAAERQQHVQEAKAATLVQRELPYLADYVGADPKRLAAVQADPATFAKVYAANHTIDRSRPKDPGELPPTTAKSAAAGQGSAGSAPALSPAAAQASAQAEYISALRHNPAFKGMSLGQLQAYIGLQPAPGKNPTGKDNAINTVLAMGETEFAAADKQAAALAATDPAKAQELRASAAQAWRDLVLRVAAQPDPVGDYRATEEGKK